MKKQGFTLIELMVVIVIMGILAAVAVPKLFGMIAKSKASEVGPAAGEYVKLQDAYTSEVGEYIGNWIKIGYAGPGTADADKLGSKSTNFTYSDEGSYTDGTVTFTTATVGWKTVSNVALNDCQKGKYWQLSAVGNAAAGGNLVYTNTIEDDANCSPLTPAFKNIAH